MRCWFPCYTFVNSHRNHRSSPEAPPWWSTYILRIREFSAAHLDWPLQWVPRRQNSRLTAYMAAWVVRSLQFGPIPFDLTPMSMQRCKRAFILIRLDVMILFIFIYENFCFKKKNTEPAPHYRLALAPSVTSDRDNIYKDEAMIFSALVSHPHCQRLYLLTDRNKRIRDNY